MDPKILKNLPDRPIDYFWSQTKTTSKIGWPFWDNFFRFDNKTVVKSSKILTIEVWNIQKNMYNVYLVISPNGF